MTNVSAKWMLRTIDVISSLAVDFSLRAVISRSTGFVDVSPVSIVSTVAGASAAAPEVLAPTAAAASPVLASSPGCTSIDDVPAAPSSFLGDSGLLLRGDDFFGAVSPAAAAPPA